MMTPTTSEAVHRRRFSVDDLTRMAEAGIFRDEERLELIDGELIEMPQPGPRHSGHVDRLNALFAARCARRCIVRVQNPLLLDRYNLFLPDVALLKTRDDFYTSRYPHPGDTLLAVEVADTSLARDRDLKLPIYARLGVRAVWILDLRRRCLHRFDDLQAGAYRTAARCSGEDLLAITEDGEVTVAELLGVAP